MEILKLNRRIFITVSLYPLPRERKRHLECIQNSCSILIGIILILIVWGSGLSLVELIQKNEFERNAFALIEVMAPIPIFLSFVSLIYRRKNIREFCSKTQQIVDQCNLIFVVQFPSHSYIFRYFADISTPVALFYLRANKVCEIFIKWTTIFFAFSIIASMLTPVVAGILSYQIRDGHVEAKNLYLTVHIK